MVSVPVHGNRTILPGTLADILNEAGLSVDEFIALLSALSKPRLR